MEGRENGESNEASKLNSQTLQMGQVTAAVNQETVKQ